MFPWVYEFRWTTGHLLFLGIFFSVLLTIGLTVVRAAWKTYRDFQDQKQEHLSWKADFEDLSPLARSCRHEISGKVRRRSCPNEFDCRVCANHRVTAGRLPSAGPPARRGADAGFCGLDVPLDRLYHRGHTWVKEEREGVYLIGLDDFASRLIGPPDQVDLPAPGTRLQANGKGWRMRRQSTIVRILSPLDGEVIGQGGAQQGWYLKVRADSRGNKMDHLLRGEEVRSWVLRELERLQMALATDGVGMSLADGGELVYDVTLQDPHADWDSVLGEMFLQA